MTYNVFGGTLNLAQSTIAQPTRIHYRKKYSKYDKQFSSYEQFS